MLIGQSCTDLPAREGSLQPARLDFLAIKKMMILGRSRLRLLAIDPQPLTGSQLCKQQTRKPQQNQL